MFLSPSRSRLSFLLLSASAMFYRSVERSRAADLGFDPRSVALARLDLKGSRYTAETGTALYSTALSRVLENPGCGERVARPIGAIRTRRSGTGDDRCGWGFRGTARLDEPGFTRILFDTQHSAPGGSGFQQFRPRGICARRHRQRSAGGRDCGDRLRPWRVD